MDEIPAIVAKFAAQIGMPPMKWRVGPTGVVIIFENGQKMTFDRVEPPATGPVEPTKPPTTRRGQAATRKAR